MLVLSRREYERILIGEDIVVTVCRIEGNRVRLGIEAPAKVRVLREELVECGMRNAECGVKNNDSRTD